MIRFAAREAELRDRSLEAELRAAVPGAPEHFRKIVEETARRQERLCKEKNNGAQQAERNTGREKSASAGALKRGSKKGKISLRRCLIIAAAAVLVTGSLTVLANGGFSLSGWLSEMGISEEKAVEEELIQTGETAEGTPLAIQEIYVDGNLLVFTAKAELGASYTGAKDHSTVNGQDRQVDCFELQEAAEDGDIYRGIIRLDGELTGESVSVTMNLYVSDDGTVPFSFETDQVNLEAAESAQTQEIIPLDGGSVTVTKLLVSPSGITVNLHFAFSGENAQEQLNQYHLLYTIADDCGNQIDSRYDIVRNLESETEQDGEVYSKDIYLELRGLDSECSSLTFTPYYTETDEEGKSVPDTGVSREDAAFTVHVTD